MAAAHIYDVIIIGAGASGLSCASHLIKQKVDLAVLEARDRLGGRIFSRLTSQKPFIPLELGAEFIHAASPLLFSLLEEMRMGFYDVQFEQHYRKGGKLIHQKNLWEEYEKVLSFSRGRKDRSMGEFIKAHRRAMTPEILDFLIGYLEGFAGADVDLLGEKSFLDSEKEKRDLNELNDFRPLGAYQDVLRGLLSGTDLEKRIHLRHSVESVHLKNKIFEVTVRGPSGRRKIFLAHKIVLSTPLSVLRGSHPHSRIEFDAPVHKHIESFSHLHMGHVQRLCFVFKNRFWEKLSPKTPVCFLRASPQEPFPTWWTLSPLRTPYLMAWQGGPKALEMSAWTNEERISTALKTLAKITGKSTRFFKEHILEVHQHNWSQDPYAMGAYSYTGVGAGRLRSSHRDLLWFTGEAFAPGDGQGTVHGALEHGKRTADLILKKP